MGCCVDVHGPWYHWKTRECQGSGLPPRIVSEGRVATGAMFIWVAYTATCGHSYVLTCCQSLCWDVWSYHNEGLCWCLWHKLLSTTKYMTGVYEATCYHIGTEGPCHHQGLTDLNGKHCHPGPCWLPDLNCVVRGAAGYVPGTQLTAHLALYPE